MLYWSIFLFPDRSLRRGRGNDIEIEGRRGKAERVPRLLLLTLMVAVLGEGLWNLRLIAMACSAKLSRNLGPGGELGPWYLCRVYAIRYLCHYF